MHSQYASSSGCTLRTLQRDFQTIEELFGLTIRHDKLRGYYLAEQVRSGADYGELLLNFEILNAIDADSDRLGNNCAVATPTSAAAARSTASAM